MARSVYGSLRPEVLSLLCNPMTHEPLKFVAEPGANGNMEGALVSVQSGQRFSVRDGIPVFLDNADVSGSNARYQKLYDRLAPVYDLSTQLYALVRSGSEEKRRREYLDELEIKLGDNVLEVSVGTGANLRYLPPHAHYFGLDLSWGMLKQCQRQIKRRNLDVVLFQGAAEHLSFVDACFDVVFHMGGINFFNDKAGAIGEMIRVAKPGTKFVIVDETEQLARHYEKTPVAGQFYGDRGGAISAPVDLVPQDMLDVQVKLVGNGDLYCLMFRKPR